MWFFIFSQCAGILPTPCSCSQATVERAWKPFRTHTTTGVPTHGQSNIMAKKLSEPLGSYHCWWLFHGYQIQTNIIYIINNLRAMFLHISLTFGVQQSWDYWGWWQGFWEERCQKKSLFETQLLAEQIPFQSYRIWYINFVASGRGAWIFVEGWDHWRHQGHVCNLAINSWSIQSLVREKCFGNYMMGDG